ncbi:MAG: SPOR domain-containing protein [Flavobacteriia bacterium]|nr:SPOR domain-containing protein [Flavobacteriia bacterium]
MKVIRLILCTLAFLVFQPTYGQNQGELRQRANPAFTRSYENYLRVNERRTLEGYRVQVFNGTGQGANRFKSQVIRSLPDMEVNVVFETPDYKIQIGNYRSAFEAEAALNEIRETFPGAFVVKTAIAPPALIGPETEDEEEDENRLDVEDMHRLSPQDIREE